jgi:hypothetical protein
MVRVESYNQLVIVGMDEANTVALLAKEGS